MTAAVLFDLDGTLVDTSSISARRDAKDWRGCVAALRSTTLYPGIRDLTDALTVRRIPWGVVTSSVSFYADAVLRHHGLTCAVLVAYHDVTLRKPHPEGCYKALGAMGGDAASAIGVGDLRVDCEAYLGAGLRAYGAGWNPAVERDCAWTGLPVQPGALLSLL